MTSPHRKRSDRSRKRLTELEKLEIVERARRCANITETLGDYGANCAPLTRSDCVLIGKAVRGNWDVPEQKRAEIIQQISETLNSDDHRLTLAVVRLVIRMEAANHAKS